MFNTSTMIKAQNPKDNHVLDKNVKESQFIKNKLKDIRESIQEVFKTQKKKESGLMMYSTLDNKMTDHKKPEGSQNQLKKDSISFKDTRKKSNSQKCKILDNSELDNITMNPSTIKSQASKTLNTSDKKAMNSRSKRGEEILELESTDGKIFQFKIQNEDDLGIDRYFQTSLHPSVSIFYSNFQTQDDDFDTDEEQYERSVKYSLNDVRIIKKSTLNKLKKSHQKKISQKQKFTPRFKDLTIKSQDLSSLDSNTEV